LLIRPLHRFAVSWSMGHARRGRQDGNEPEKNFRYRQTGDLSRGMALQSGCYNRRRL